jgi:glycosyltransferase involved in cell wall biosynthesis
MWTLTAGLPDLKMVELYNSFDVMMLLTRGEGFCVPLIESQACGVPVITTDFTAPSDLVGAGWKVPSIGTRYTPMNSFWAEPDIEAGVRALEECYALWKAKKLKEELAVKARAFAKQYDFDVVYKDHMQPFLERVEDELREKREAAEAQGDGRVRQEAAAEQGGGVHRSEQRPPGSNGRGGGGKTHSSRKRRRNSVRQVASP